MREAIFWSLMLFGLPHLAAQLLAGGSTSAAGVTIAAYALFQVVTAMYEDDRVTLTLGGIMVACAIASPFVV